MITVAEVTGSEGGLWGPGPWFEVTMACDVGRCGSERRVTAPDSPGALVARLTGSWTVAPCGLVVCSVHRN